MEILDNILYNLDSHVDLYALTRTCRRLNIACSSTKTSFRANFLSPSGRYLLPRHHTFIANITSQLGHWANESQAHEERMKTAFGSGFDDLFNLAAQVAWVTLDDIRRAHSASDEIIPFLENLFAMENKPSSSGSLHLTPCHGRSVSETVLLFVAYCGLFRHDVNFAKDLPEAPLQFSRNRRSKRLCFMRCRAPENCPCYGYPSVWGPDLPVPFRWEVFKRTDIFIKRRKALIRFWWTGEIILEGAELLDVSNKGEWHFVLVCEHQGWPSLVMLLPGGIEEFSGLLTDIRSHMMGAVDSISEFKGQSMYFGPDFCEEVRAVCGGDRRTRRRLHRAQVEAAEKARVCLAEKINSADPVTLT